MRASLGDMVHFIMTKDNILAQYAVNSMKTPIGISEYELSNVIPEKFKSSLPTIEEIEKGLLD